MLDGTLHMGMDYHAVTATTVQDLYPLPPVEYLLNYVYSISWFTQLHCAVGYYWINSATAKWNKRAFTSTHIWYKWWVPQIALGKVPSQLMHMRTSSLVPMTRKITGRYLNELIFHSHTVAEHVVHVNKMLPLPSEYGLKAKDAKCGWPWQNVVFCGIDIDKNCIHAPEHKIHAVMDWPPAEDYVDVRGVLGLKIY